MMQGKDTLNKNQSLPCRRWWHGPLFFIHRFLRLVLLLLLHHSGKIAIPHYHLFLILQILHLALFKSLQRLLRSIFDLFFVHQFRNFVLLVLQQCGDDCVVIGCRWTPFEISGCSVELVDVAQCKCRRKQWFVFYAFLWTCRVTDYYQILSVGNFLPHTWRGLWSGGRWRGNC